MRRSETRLRGMGECILRIDASELRDVSELPDEVEIVAVLPPPNSEYVPGYAVDRFPHIVADRLFAYIHIRSRYAVRRSSGAPLMIEEFDKFLESWQSLSKDQR